MSPIKKPVGLSARDEEKSREVRRIRFKNPTFLSAPGVLFWKYFSRSTLQNRDLSLQLYKHQFCITRSQTQRVLLFLQPKKKVRFLNEKVEQWGILWAESGKKYIFSFGMDKENANLGWIVFLFFILFLIVKKWELVGVFTIFKSQSRGSKHSLKQHRSRLPATKPLS